MISVQGAWSGVWFIAPEIGAKKPNFGLQFQSASGIVNVEAEICPDGGKCRYPGSRRANILLTKLLRTSSIENWRKPARNSLVSKDRQPGQSAGNLPDRIFSNQRRSSSNGQPHSCHDKQVIILIYHATNTDLASRSSDQNHQAEMWEPFGSAMASFQKKVLDFKSQICTALRQGPVPAGQ